VIADVLYSSFIQRCNRIVLKARDVNGVFNPIKFAVIQFLDAAWIGVDVSFSKAVLKARLEI
jgi:hypothetical protein